MLPLLCLMDMFSAFWALVFAKVAVSKYHTFHGLSNRNVVLHCRRKMEGQAQLVSSEVSRPCTGIFSQCLHVLFSIFLLVQQCPLFK